MYGIEPIVASTVTSTARLRALPYRAAMKSAIEVRFCRLLTVMMR